MEKIAEKEPVRAVQIRTALWLEAITLIWMVVEAVGSIGAGIVARSLLLVAFGIDSVIELISATLVMGQLSKEARALPHEEESMEELKENVSRISGYLLFALSAYVVAQAGYGLLHRHHAQESLLGIGIAVVAAVAMPLIARAKIRVADAMGNRALRADAMESLTCGYLSWVLLGGLVINAVFHWWWLDSVAALAIVPILIREGREAITGECCCDDDNDDD